MIFCRAPRARVGAKNFSPLPWGKGALFIPRFKEIKTSRFRIFVANMNTGQSLSKEQIQTLSTVRGRAILRDIFRELRYEKQLTSITTLLTCWRLCVAENETARYSKRDVRIVHTLGLFRGTSLWLQEIVNRFYFSAINSLVYLGASMLLVVVSGYRFTETVDSRFVIAGVALEAFMLFILFVVMFFSPSDDVEMEEQQEDELKSLIEDTNDIAGELDAALKAFRQALENQNSVINAIQRMASDAAHSISLSAQPQPEFIETMKDTNQTLHTFHQNLQSFVEAANSLRREEIQRAVRVEVEKILQSRVE